MKTNKLQIVTFGQAKALKELGFDGGAYPYSYTPTGELSTNRECLDTYVRHLLKDGYIEAPTVAYALKWMRDIKKICMTIETKWDNYFYVKACKPYYIQIGDGEASGTWEDAERELLDILLDWLEEIKDVKG